MLFSTSSCVFIFVTVILSVCACMFVWVVFMSVSVWLCVFMNVCIYVCTSVSARVCSSILVCLFMSMNGVCVDLSYMHAYVNMHVWYECIFE